jgi:DNA-binding response OmpR family regulator
LKGYKSGADDYITKPFDIEELLARIEAVLKRTKFTESLFSTSDDSVIIIGSYSYNSENLVYKPGKGYSKTDQKGRTTCLNYLYLKRNEVLTSGLALKVIWGNDDYFMGRSMDVYVSKLRKYLGDDPKSKY